MLIAKVDKIIELRKAHGLNQKRLSEKAGLPVNAVFRIETGAYTRTQDLRAKAIANALECKVEEIFTSEQEPEHGDRAAAGHPAVRHPGRNLCGQRPRIFDLRPGPPEEKEQGGTGPARSTDNPAAAGH